MKKLINLRLVSAIALIAGAAVSTRGADLLSNPGFETGDFTDWTPTTFGSQVTLAVDTSGPNAGSYNVSHVDDLNAGVNNELANSVIEQTVDVTGLGGHIFTASIFSDQTAGGAVNLILSLDFDLGLDTGITEATTSGYSQTILSGHIPLGATTGIFSVKLDKTAAGKPTVLLDDASLTSVIPEPATFGLLGLGLGALGLCRRRA